LLEWTDVVLIPFEDDVGNRLNIGRFANFTPAGTNFSGCMDEVRIYSGSLSTWQVYQLYMSSASLKTNLVTSDSPLLTGIISDPLDRITITIAGNTYTGTNNGDGTWSLPAWTITPALTNGVESVVLNVMNPYNKTFSYNANFDILIPSSINNIYIYGPSLLSITGSVENSANILEYQFDYFSVYDGKWLDSWYYTTISMDTLSGPWWSSISNASLQWKGDPITVLSGTTNPRVVVSTGIQSYTVANVVTTFIKRDNALNSDVKGEYGSKLSIKATIPAYQKPGTYTGTITYTLYEN